MFYCNHILGDPGGSQSGREKGREESFQVRAKEPLGTDCHRTTVQKFNRMPTPDWAQTKNALYYCAQSANGFSCVPFVAPFLPTRLTAPGSQRML